LYIQWAPLNKITENVISWLKESNGPRLTKSQITICTYRVDLVYQFIVTIWLMFSTFLCLRVIKLTGTYCNWLKICHLTKIKEKQWKLNTVLIVIYCPKAKLSSNSGSRFKFHKTKLTLNHFTSNKKLERSKKTF